MIYRIDFQHFMTHAIDYFTREELNHFEYCVISAKIKNTGGATNVAKANDLYPTTDIVITYAEYKDKKMLEKMYIDYLSPDKSNGETKSNAFTHQVIYDCFINTLLKHQDVVILCDVTENDYIDVLCKYLKKTFLIEVIDLNQLFKEGKVGSIYIDRDKIHDNAVDLRRNAAKEEIERLSTTYDGRLRLAGKMSKKEKIKKLKELGVAQSEIDKGNIDKMFIEEWVERDDE